MNPSTSPDVTVEELLAHAGWARRLAVRLTGGDDTADDLVQETWIAAARHPPAGDRPLRPWLAVVLRNLFLKGRQGAQRREARERAAEVESEVASPELLLQRVEIQRQLAEAVAALEEPYRYTLILRYFEDLSAAEIARRMALPPGTVRWRLKTALDELRRKLRADHDHPARWLAPLLPVGRSRRPWLWLWAGAVSVGAALVLTLGVVPRGRRLTDPMSTLAAPEKLPVAAGGRAATPTGDLPACRREVARLRAESAAAEVERHQRLSPDELFALGPANPTAAAAITPALERVLASPGTAAPAHTLECRAWACRLKVALTREEAARVNAWMLPLQRDEELRARTAGFAFLGSNPTKDPLSGVPLDQSDVYIALADPSGQPVPEPRQRPAPAPSAAPLPTTAGACAGEARTLRLQLQQAREEVENRLSPVERFDRGAPDVELTRELRALLTQKFPGPASASLELECRARVCRVRWEQGPERWQSHLHDEPRFGAMIDSVMSLKGASYFTLAPGPRADGLGFLQGLVKRFEAGPAAADCERRFPARGDLWVKLDLPKTGTPNDHGELNRVAASYGNELAGTPLGKCIEAAIASTILAAPLPDLPVGEVVIHYHLEFPRQSGRTAHDP